MLTTEPPGNSHHLHFKSGEAEVTAVKHWSGVQSTRQYSNAFSFFSKVLNRQALLLFGACVWVQKLRPGNMQGLGSVCPQALYDPV